MRIAPKYLGPSLVVIAAFLWAFDGFLRQNLSALHPPVIVFYEHVIGALVIAPFALPLLGREKVDGPTWKALGSVSALSGVVGTLCFTAALVKTNYISISVVFLLQKFQPLFAIAAGNVLLKERISAPFVAWGALAFGAAYFVTFKGGQIELATGAGTATAALLALGAAVAWGSSTALSRFSVLRISNTLALGIRFALTAPLALFVVILFGQTGDLAKLTAGQFGNLLAIALSTGMVALWIYYKGLQQTEVKVATLLEYVFPTVAVLLDFLINHTVLAPSQYAASLVLFFAIYRVSRLNRGATPVT